MPKIPIERMALHKVLEELYKHDDITSHDIAKNTKIPLNTVRKVLGELKQVGRVESRFVYRVKK